MNKMQKLLAFSNMKKFDYHIMESYHRRNNIFFTIDGQNKGGERAVFIYPNEIKSEVMSW